MRVVQLIGLVIISANLYHLLAGLAQGGEQVVHLLPLVGVRALAVGGDASAPPVGAAPAPQDPRSGQPGRRHVHGRAPVMDHQVGFVLNVMQN